MKPAPRPSAGFVYLGEAHKARSARKTKWAGRTVLLRRQSAAPLFFITLGPRRSAGAARQSNALSTIMPLNFDITSQRIEDAGSADETDYGKYFN